MLRITLFPEIRARLWLVIVRGDRCEQMIRTALHRVPADGKELCVLCDQEVLPHPPENRSRFVRLVAPRWSEVAVHVVTMIPRAVRILRLDRPFVEFAANIGITRFVDGGGDISRIASPAVAITATFGVERIELRAAIRPPNTESAINEKTSKERRYIVSRRSSPVAT